MSIAEVITPAAGLHLIVLPHAGERTVNAILLEGEPLTLVDTGLGREDSLAALRAGLAALGYRVRDLARIVITHPHLDHFGAAAALLRESDATLAGDAGGLDIMARWPAHWPESQEYRMALFTEAGVPLEVLDSHRRWGDWYARQGAPVQLDRPLWAGDTIAMGGATWRVIDVPGHAATSIALHDPERGVLVSGDILLGAGSASVTLHRLGDGRLPAGWQAQILDSLDRLSRLNLRLVLPGHGPPLTEPVAALTERRQRVEARLAQVRDLIAGAPLCADEVAAILYEPAVASSGLGLSQALSYLDALELRGQATAAVVEGIRRYRAAREARPAGPAADGPGGR